MGLKFKMAATARRSVRRSVQSCKHLGFTFNLSEQERGAQFIALISIPENEWGKRSATLPPVEHRVNTPTLNTETGKFQDFEVY